MTRGLIATLLLMSGAQAAAQNSVTITPAGQLVAGTNQITITIKWCGYPPPATNYMDINSRSIQANWVDVTGDFDLQFDQAACGFQGPVADEVLYTSTGTITVDASTGPVTVYADISNSLGYHWTAMETYYPPSARRAVSVRAEQQLVTPEPSSARSERFTITNLGNADDTYSLATTGCSSGAVATSCSLSPSGPVAVSAGASTVVTASYTASGTTGTVGLLRLKATSTGDAATKDSAWTDVTITATPTVGVAIVGTAPGRNDVVSRGACVTVALTDHAASECGDLRLVHPLPSARTMGTVRTPTLLYNSQHARPKPLVMADVRLSGSVALPPNVTACIKVSGVSRGCGTWTGSSWGTAGSTRRVVVAGDDGTWNTGHVDFTLEVTASNANQGPYTATGRLFIVNRSGASFGAGWWLAGLERLVVVSSTELVWIGGDGSARRYVKSGSTWYAPNYAERDSIQAAATGYVRRTAEHARVYFSGAGRHDSTVNSVRHVTKFVYTDTLLTKVQVPKPSGWLDYDLVYSSGRLDSVAAPQSRGVKVFRTTARVDSIRDPDGNAVRFTSGTSLNQYVVTARTDRRGNTTSFSYDGGNRVSQASRPLSSTTALAVAETQGLSTPVPLDSAFTQIDGPRTDVTDVTRLWVNGYGASTRVRNALGRETYIHYDATFPGLADSVLAPNRLATRARYNARGLVDTVRVYAPLGTPGSNAVTAYQWHASLNRPTSVRTLTSGSTWLLDSVSYNADSTMAWTQRGTGSGTRVSYTYDANRLPATLVLPGPHTATFSYSGLGNLRKEQTPLGFLTLSFEDGAGRDTLAITPRGTGTDATDSAQVVAKGVRQRTVLDKMSRDTLTMTIGPQVTLPNSRVVPVDTVRVRSTYDAEGNRLTATRGYTKKIDATQGGIYETNPSEWVYDALNRVTQQRDAGSGWTTLTLDPAGNATTTATARGSSITATYDALNRVTRRVVPQVTYASSNCHYLNGFSCGYTFPTFEGSSLCIAVDTARFGYDEAGNLRSAENNWAKVRRRYAPNGLLTYDTLLTRRYETEAPGPCGGGDRHAVGELAEGTGSDWGAHRYGLRYEYDLAGRRTKLYHPNQLDPCASVSCEQTYGYHATTGTLDTLVHPDTSGASLTTRFTYDNQLRLLNSIHPGSITIARTYDADGRLTDRNGSLTLDALGYDATGRVISGTVTHPATQATLTLSLGYNGLGALHYAAGNTPGVTYEEYKTDALGNRLWVRDPEMVDGVDRTKYHSVADNTGQLTGTALGTGTCAPPAVAQPSCHPAWYVYEYAQGHDLSGNVSETWGKDTRGTSAFDAAYVTTETRSYYAADEKLTYYNRQVGLTTPGEGTGLFEEYRYDALGRRVLTRSRRVSGCSYPCEAFIQRTVWDGSQVLYEVRSSGNTGVAASTMELEGGVATGDDANLYGIIAYAHAQGIDQPVGVLKQYGGSGGATNVWGYVTPQANYQGVWSYGTFRNGTTCVAFGQQCPNWPGFALSMDGGTTGTDVPTYTVWWGDIIRGTSGTSGLQYLRNRYYDAKTGRFTQLDPIGLAGGLNLYGFAGGDPVNHSDPFGLCPDGCVIEGSVGGLVLLGVAATATVVALTNGEEIGEALGAGGRAARDFAVGIWAAVSDKQHQKHLRGLQENIETHFTWLGGGGSPGKDPDRWGDKWKKDIQKGIGEMRKRLERLKSDKDRDQWRKTIEQIEKRLQDAK